MHRGVAVQEFQDKRRHDFARARREGVDTQRSGGRRLLGADHLHRAVQVAQGRPRLFDEGAAGVGERDAARRPVEQTHAHRRFELRHGIAQRRRRQAERPGGAAERALARHGEGGLELAQPNPVHSYLSRLS